MECDSRGASMATTSDRYRILGARLIRKEDPRFISGTGNYTEDVLLNGMCYLAVLRSPHAHALINEINTSHASNSPGVLYILTGSAAATACKQELPTYGVTERMNVRSRYPLAVTKARYVGEPIVAIVATSLGEAKDALDLVEIDYTILDPVIDLETAATQQGPPVHEDLESNICFHSAGTTGNPELAFKNADGIVTERFVQPRIVVNPMEPRSTIASYDKTTDRLIVWSTSQEPHRERNELSEVIGIPQNKIRVISQDVGGGFGCKIGCYPESYITAILSIRLNKPVKWVEERQEHFTNTTQGRGEIQYVEAAYRNDGTLTGLKISFLTDLGAYSHGGTHSTANKLTPAGASGPYKLTDIAWTTTGYYTNKTPVGPYRGYGRHATAYILERIIDIIANKTGYDPVEVRKKNLLSENQMPYLTPTGLKYDSGNYLEALENAVAKADYKTLRKQQIELRKSGTIIGIGAAITVDCSGFGPTGGLSARAGYESATIRIEPSGKATLLTGSSPHGQGLETTMAQIVAHELGINVDDVEVIHSDTFMVPQGNGTYGSRSIVVGGSAALNASRKVKQKAIQIAAFLLNTQSQYVQYEDGVFYAEDIPDRSVTWEEMARYAYSGGSLPSDIERGLDATTFYEPPDYTYSYSAGIAVVNIDAETGDVKLERYISSDDCGIVINPLIVDGQTHGALAQGIGAALMEETIWDNSGQVITGSFMDYAIPMADQFPMFELVRTETPSPNNPLGVKGGGELGITASVPAVVNAVVDGLLHLGVTNIDIPVTPEKVWRSMNGYA